VKTVDLSAKGAKCESLGQRPRRRPVNTPALKARNNVEYGVVYAVFDFMYYFAPSSLPTFMDIAPGALPKAFTFRAFGAEIHSFYTVSTALGSVSTSFVNLNDLQPYFSVFGPRSLILITCPGR
jgi:hypothetical protein